MSTQVDLTVKIAPPDRAAAILTAKGYPINAKLLRRLYKQGKIPGTFTGKRVLLPIDRVIDLLEHGEAIETPAQSGAIRRVEG